MDLNTNNSHINPFFSVADDEEAVIAVDVSNDDLVDSVTTITQTPIPPDLIMSVGHAEEEEPNKLTLAYEKMYDLPKAIVDRFADHIRYLDISHNKITNLDVLVHFKHLTSLIADNNPLTENSFLPPLPKLQLLWLNHCKISSLYPWMGQLKESCPNLQILSLMGNPAAPSLFSGGTFYEYLQYRLFVISQFPSLHHLDDRKVSDDQREEAIRLYRRPLVERIMRPGSSSFSQLMHSPVSLTGIQNRVMSLLGKGKTDGRNLPI